MPVQLRRRRLNASSYLSEAQIRAAYKLYCDAELSTGELGEMLWEKLGYKNANICTQSLFKAFRLRKFKLRGRSESRKIVMARKGFAMTPEARAEKRRVRYEEEMGRPHQPQCPAFHAETGERCKQPCKVGATRCQFHLGWEPERLCKGTTVRGTMCKRLRSPGKEYCSKHTKEAAHV